MAIVLRKRDYFIIMEKSKIQFDVSDPEPDSSLFCWVQNREDSTTACSRKRSSGTPVVRGQLPTMVRRFLVTTVFAGLVACCADARAEVPIEDFLSALQRKGHFEVALSYLDRMAKSDLAPAGFADELDYRRGSVLIAHARSTRNASLKRAKLDAAENSLDRFISKHPEHPSAAVARSQLGNILVERAREKMKQAKADESSRKELAAEANKIYQRAFDMLTASRTAIGEQYKALVANRDPERKSEVEAIKEKYVQTYIAIARILFEQAETLQGRDRAYKAKLREAATAFDEVTNKYRNFGAGIYALLYEGECYQLMGDHRQALTYYKELLQNKSQNKAIRGLKARALTKSMECWMVEDLNEGPDRAINQAVEWLKGIRGDEEEQTNWLELRLALAKAYKKKSEIEKKKGMADRAASEAKKIVSELARKRSAVQKEAQTILVALGGADLESTRTEAAAEDFVGAREIAIKSLDGMKLSSATVSILSGQLERISDPQRRKDVEAKLEEARSQVASRSAESLELFRAAVDLATEDEIDELNGVRYYIAFLHYSQQQYRRAAIIAGYVALNYPDSIAAKECANVALASRQRLYQKATGAERALHSGQVAKLAELMVTRWPGQSQSETALLTLLDVSIQRGDIEKAEAYLAKIPAESTKRGKAELRIGQAFWSEYLKRSAATDDPAELDDLQKMKYRAQDILDAGIQNVMGEPPNETTLRAALSLAQIYVDLGKADLAIDLLERRSVGALWLVQNESPWLERIPGISTEAYKTAIRAHVASAAGSGNASSDIKQAQKLLDELRTRLEAETDGQKRMMGIYVSLARDLERQLVAADTKSRKALSRGFESFLRGAAEGSKDISVLNWVGETFFSMGNGMLKGTRSSPEAQRYFTEASSAYEQVLSLAAKDPAALSPEATKQVKVRQAMCLRQLGRFEDSIDLFADVLSEKVAVLNIQVEAAKTLQQWGATGNAQGYQKAIQGDRPGAAGKNVIWGWGRIANLVARNKSFRDTFHEARYNLALSRYRYANASSGGKQKELLGRAKSDILLTKRLVGLGTKQQEKRYDSLLRQIQKALGEQVTGTGASS